MYLICEARPLADQWECDAEIIPERIVDDWKTAPLDETKYYEIWEILEDGSLTLLKEWDEDEESDDEDISEADFFETAFSSLMEDVPSEYKSYKGIKEVAGQKHYCFDVKRNANCPAIEEVEDFFYEHCSLVDGRRKDISLYGLGNTIFEFHYYD